MSSTKTFSADSPSLETILDFARKRNIEITQEEALQYKECMDASLGAYRRLDEIQDTKATLKYPRHAGYKPTKEENPYNAWLYKTDIPGAKEGKLQGKKVVVKDCIMVAGVPVTNGSDIIHDFTPDEDATAVTRVLDEGGHIIGKTNCESLSASANSFNSATGPVLNPHNTTRSAGGSSHGNAVLLHLGEADMALGADQGGSIRIPASCCGVIGLKPTHGLVPYTGAVTFEPVVDHLGPMTHTVDDCALLLEVIAGCDGVDFRQPKGLKVPEYSKLLTGKTSGMKIAALKEGFDNCDQDVIDVVNKALDELKQNGATVEDVSIPLHRNNMLSSPLITASAFRHTYQNATATIGVRGNQNMGYIDSFWSGMKNRPDLLNPVQKWIFFFGSYLTENYGLHYTVKAHKELPKLTKAYDDVLEQYDVIVMPTIATKPPELPVDPEKLTLREYISHSFSMTANTKQFNITGHPAMSINAGYSEGLPIGVQIVGKHWDESTLLNVGYALEQTLKKK